MSQPNFDAVAARKHIGKNNSSRGVRIKSSTHAPPTRRESMSVRDHLKDSHYVDEM